jgi:hypothetical protein
MDSCGMEHLPKMSHHTMHSPNEGWTCMFSPSTNKWKNGWQQITEQNLNVLLKYKPICNVKLQFFCKMIVSHLECQSLIKDIK